MKNYYSVYSHATIEFANKVQTCTMKNLNEKKKKDQYIYMTLLKTFKLRLHQFLNYQTLKHPLEKDWNRYNQIGSQPN